MQKFRRTCIFIRYIKHYGKVSKGVQKNVKKAMHDCKRDTSGAVEAARKQSAESRRSPLYFQRRGREGGRSSKESSEKNGQQNGEAWKKKRKEQKQIVVV
jgi:hypothetical protein